METAWLTCPILGNHVVGRILRVSFFLVELFSIMRKDSEYLSSIHICNWLCTVYALIFFTWLRGTKQLEPLTGGIFSFTRSSNTDWCFRVDSVFLVSSCHLWAKYLEKQPCENKVHRIYLFFYKKEKNVYHTFNSSSIWLHSSLERLAAVAIGISFLRARLLGSSFSRWLSQNLIRWG